MLKHVLGEWGASLDDEEYGPALAGLGVLESTGLAAHPPSSDPEVIVQALREELRNGSRTVVWRDACEYRRARSATWLRTSHTAAEPIAEAWRRLQGELRSRREEPRLAVEAGWLKRPDLVDPEQLMAWLTRDETECEAVIVVPEEARQGVPRALWNWPVRVGVPAGVEGSEEVLGALESMRSEVSWVGQLADLRELGEARDTADLVVLPRGLGRQLARQPQLRLRGSFVVCLDDLIPWGKLPSMPQAALRQRMVASGLALVGSPQGRALAEWFKELVRELSHDRPIHAALWAAARRSMLPSPRILGSPEALDNLRLAGVAQRLDHRTADLPPRVTVDLLTPALRDRKFASEELDGEPVAAMVEAHEAKLEPQRLPRWLQAQGFRPDGEGEPAAAFAPDSVNLLSVFVGPVTGDARRDVPFPQDRVDFSRGPVRATIQVEIAGATVAAVPPALRAGDATVQALLGDSAGLASLLGKEEPTAAGEHVGVDTDCIVLPEAGHSTAALFAVRPLAGVAELSGRIAIVHANRVIQTAKLRAAVDSGPAAGPGITVTTEGVEHPRTDDLGDRRRFDATLIAADDLGGSLRLTVHHGGKASPVPLGNLAQPLVGLRSAVDKVTYRTDSILPLSSPTMRDALFELSYVGRLVYDELRARLGEAVESFERIQILCRGQAFLPLEYVYDGPAPNLDAVVCEHARKGLRDGRCEACPHAASAAHICPLRFWGISRVIERHACTREDDAQPGTTVAMPSPTRTPFGPLSGALVAASSRAFAHLASPVTGKDSLEESFRRVAPTCTVTDSWTSWKECVASSAPNLLTLITHTDRVGIADVLEIGQADRLPKTQIDGSVVGVPGAAELLLLLGCAAAQVTVDFAPYPARFRGAGADVIVAPLAPILGVDALAVGEYLAAKLKDAYAAHREVAFGELLRDLRRELLAEGYAGVLGIVGFGDADWVFGG